MIDDYFPYGHGEKSVRLIERHMILPDDMAMAIRYHMGSWQESDKGNVSKVFEKYYIYKMLQLMLYYICLMISEIVLEHLSVSWIIQ